MHRLAGYAVLALACFLLTGPGSSAEATTIATFADPSVGSPPPPIPMFTVDTTADTVAGLWESPGMTLATVSGTFFNVLFSLPQLNFDASFDTGPGFAEFRTSGNDLLLRIDFDSAHLANPLAFGATRFMGLNAVSFSGPVVDDSPGIVPGTESFIFGFGNQTATPDGYTATAAFIGSGDLVPEPSTVAMFGLLAIALMRRHRS